MKLISYALKLMRNAMKLISYAMKLMRNAVKLISIELKQMRNNINEGFLRLQITKKPQENDISCGSIYLKVH